MNGQQVNELQVEMDDHHRSISPLVSGRSLLANVAKTLTKYTSFEEKIDAIIRLTGNALQVSRVYIFEDDHVHHETNNTFEWCAEGIQPEKDNLQHVPIEIVEEWYEIIGSQGFLHTHHIKTLPDSIQAVLEPQGIISIVVFKLELSDDGTGFVGFDECVKERYWTQDELDILISITGIISSLYENAQLRHRLQTEERNFRNLFDSITDFIVVADQEGWVIETNRAVSEKTVFNDVKRHNGKVHILDLHPQRVYEEAKDILQDMMMGKTVRCDLPVLAMDGTEIPVETKIWQGTWNRQEVLIGISKDVSAEHDALEMFNKLFDNNPLPIAVNDYYDYSFVEVNSAFTELIGYSLDELHGKNFNNLRIFPNLADYRLLKEKIVTRGKIDGFEITLRTKGGGLLQGVLSGSTVTVKGDKRFVTVFTDLTKQIELQDRLADQNRRLEHIVESTELGTWEWDLQSNDTVFNERWAHIVGYSLEELSPTTIHTWEQLLHPDDLELSKRELEKHFRGESRFYSIECRMLHKDGTYRWVRDTGKIMEYAPDGTPSRMFGSHLDITSKKAIEQKLLEAKSKAEKDNEAKSKFLALVSHEIRTPIHTFQGLVALLSKTMLDEKQKTYTMRLQQSSNIVLETINNVLDFSKIEAEKIELEQDPFYLNELIEEVHNLFAFRFAQKGIDLVIDLNPHTPLHLIGDDFRIIQIFQNLLSNAEKFTDTGVVTVVVRGVLSNNSFTKIDISITDTGVGIEPELLPRLFEPYVQGSNFTTTNTFVGSGLGLPIVRHLVEIMGGSIDVTSTPRVGSTFLVSIPFKVVDDFTLISYGKKNFAEFDADVVVQESLHTKCVREGFALFGLPVYGIDEHPKKNERISCIVLDWEQIKAEGVQGDAMVERLLTSYGRGIFVVLSSVLASDVEIEKMLANVRLRIVKKPVCLWKILSIIARIATDEDIAGGGFEQTMQSGNGRILLCDDHVINREMVKELLVQVGYAVDTTETGRQTIQKLEQHQYDLLLLDLQMNDMDGFEVARTIRTKLCNSMPIVAFTAHALPHYEKRSRQAGMNGYLVKPVTPEQLYKEVETWVSFSHRTDTDGLHASMDSLYHEVENLFAIDFSVAMERYLHNLETYRRHLDLLMKDVRNIIDEASSTTVSTKSWKHSLHAMRGVAGNLGLLGFATRLAKHEKKLGDNMTSNSQFSQEDFLPILFEEHSKLVEMSSFLSEFPYDNSKPPKHVQSTARNLDFITMCGNLMEALSLGDFEDAYTLVGAMKASTAERETKIILEAVMEHIKNYDFTLAEKELDCICTHSFSPKERRS